MPLPCQPVRWFDSIFAVARIFFVATADERTELIHEGPGFGERLEAAERVYASLCATAAASEISRVGPSLQERKIPHDREALVAPLQVLVQVGQRAGDRELIPGGDAA